VVTSYDDKEKKKKRERERERENSSLHVLPLLVSSVYTSAVAKMDEI
jgi:hypothetical protein